VKQPAVYIVVSRRNGTLYAGVTSDLMQCVSQHLHATGDSFAARHGCTLLVFYELHADMTAAINREKQLKSGSRARKLALIGAANPTWRDLYDDILYPPSSLRGVHRRGVPGMARIALAAPGLPRRKSGSQ